MGGGALVLLQYLLKLCSPISYSSSSFPIRSGNQASWVCLVVQWAWISYLGQAKQLNFGVTWCKGIISMCMGIGACYAVDWLIAPVIETNVKVFTKVYHTKRFISRLLSHLFLLVTTKGVLYINWFHYIWNEFTNLNKQGLVENSEFITLINGELMDSTHVL